jgi:hypothetical protein
MLLGYLGVAYITRASEGFYREFFYHLYLYVIGMEMNYLLTLTRLSPPPLPQHTHSSIRKNKAACSQPT